MVLEHHREQFAKNRVRQCSPLAQVSLVGCGPNLVMFHHSGSAMLFDLRCWSRHSRERGLPNGRMGGNGLPALGIVLPRGGVD